MLARQPMMNAERTAASAEDADPEGPLISPEAVSWLTESGGVELSRG